MSARNIDETGPVPRIDLDFDPVTRSYHDSGPRYPLLPPELLESEAAPPLAPTARKG